MFSKWCHISGLLVVVATGITNLAACADMINPDPDDRAPSPASMGCESVDTADGEVDLVDTADGDVNLVDTGDVGLVDTADGDVKLLSCEHGTPVDEQELDSCNTYYGPCSGANGRCSFAAGEGYYVWSCVPFTYAGLIVCNGYPYYIVDHC